MRYCASASARIALLGATWLLAAEPIVAQPNIEDDRGLRFGQVGDGEQILGFEIGDDEGIALAHNFLGLGDHVAIGGQ
jgi:hypothetical protein